MKRSCLVIVLLATIAWLSACQHVPRHGEIEVITMAREVDTHTSGHEMCNGFTLTKENVETYFTVAKEVDGHAFHHEVLILPCRYTGTIRFHEERLQWTIYAGGAGYLYDKDTVNKRYLCKEKCCALISGLC